MLRCRAQRELPNPQHSALGSYYLAGQVPGMTSSAVLTLDPHPQNMHSRPPSPTDSRSFSLSPGLRHPRPSVVQLQHISSLDLSPPFSAPNLGQGQFTSGSPNAAHSLAWKALASTHHPATLQNCYFSFKTRLRCCLFGKSSLTFPRRLWATTLPPGHVHRCLESLPVS